MPDGYILGLDAGTSVVKAAIFDLQGNELSRGARSVPITNPEPHLAEEDMQEVWVAATEAISHALVNGSVRADQILGISATGQGDGSWLIDRDGKPRGPAILWTDGRAGDIVDAWNTDGSITRQFDVSGTGPYAGTTSALLRWRQENQPELLDGAINLWCKDWIEYNLTGDASTDPSDASLAGIDAQNRRYSDKVFEAFGINEQTRAALPPLRNPTELCGNVTRHAAQVTGLREGTPVFKGQMDITASSLGVGVARPGDCMAVVGTAGIVTVATNDLSTGFQPPDVGWVIPHGPDTWIRALGMSNCTPNLDWYLREFGEPFREEAAAQAPEVGLFDFLDAGIKADPGRLRRRDLPRLPRPRRRARAVHQAQRAGDVQRHHRQPHPLAPAARGVRGRRLRHPGLPRLDPHPGRDRPDGRWRREQPGLGADLRRRPRQADRRPGRLGVRGQGRGDRRRCRPGRLRQLRGGCGRDGRDRARVRAGPGEDRRSTTTSSPSTASSAWRRSTAGTSCRPPRAGRPRA